MKTAFAFIVLLTALASCEVGPEAAAERRADLMAKVFPDPADRQGLYLVFPLESGGLNDTLLITHFVNEVGRDEVVRRVARYCTRLGSSRLTGGATLAKALGNRTLSLPGGTLKPGFEGRYDCTAA